MNSDNTESSLDSMAVLNEKENIGGGFQGDKTPENIKAEVDGTVQYPHGPRFVLVMVALCSSVFLLALDNSILATAIPRITDHFKSLDDVAWYGSAYLLTIASFQLIFGKFYTFLSIKWVYLVAIGIFEIGSFICGIAPSSSTLIIGRAVAGLGGAGIFTGALVIIAHSVPLQERPLYTGVVGSMYGIASIAGPLLGGLLTDKASWRWCFYINLPIGAVTLVIIVFLFLSPPQAAVNASTFKGRMAQFDIAGTIVFLPALVCLLLALQWGGNKYAWSSGTVIALLVVFGVLLLVFAAIQVWMKENATLPLHILRIRSMWASSWFAFTLAGAFFIYLIYLPIWFQVIKNDSPVRSGIHNLPMLLSQVVTIVVTGALITNFGQYAPFMIASSVVASIGAGILTLLAVSTPTGQWIGYQIIFGIGIGLGMQQPLMAAQSVLKMTDIPTGIAIVNFAQTIGGAIFIAIAQSVFTNSLISNLRSFVPDLDPNSVVNTGATELQSTITKLNPDFLPAVLEAYNGALTRSYDGAVAMACLSLLGALFVEWVSMKGKTSGASAA